MDRVMSYRVPSGGLGRGGRELYPGFHFRTEQRRENGDGIEANRRRR